MSAPPLFGMRAGGGRRVLVGSPSSVMGRPGFSRRAAQWPDCRSRALPESQLKSALVDVGKLRLHHTYGGARRPIVFVHGLRSSGYIEWRFTLPRFARSHRVFAPDLPGFGPSDN